MRTLKAAFAVACGLLTPAAMPASAEDLTIVYKDAGRFKGSSARYMSSMRTRWDHDHFSNITDMVQGKFATIDHQKKEFYEETPQEQEAALRLTDQRLAKSIAALKE